MKRIAIIICYFGKLPWYLKYFLHSCAYNPSVDFYIVTDDNSFGEDCPTNVCFVFKTFQEINKLATEKLGFAVNIEDGYKFCDFKPAYGFLFSEIISGFHFWGHGDIDVIFGNIRNFVTDEIMENYDLISIRPDWTPGCFLLFKNIAKMNNLFMQSNDYEKVFSSNRHFCFDETNFRHDDFADGKRFYEIPSEVESMMHVIRRLEAAGYIRPYFEMHIIEGRPGKLKWDKGILIYKNEYEVILYHLIKLKQVYHPKAPPNKIPNTFCISPTRIYS